jgi:hypothetical protein
MKNQSQRLSLAVLLGLLILATGRAVQAEETGPADDYAKGRLDAIRTGRPLVVLAGAPWCRPCREVGFLIPRLRKEGVFVHLDVGRNLELARVLGISQLPTVIVWRQAEQGWVVTRAIGVPAIKKLFEPSPPAVTPGSEPTSGLGRTGAQPSR